MSKVADIGSSYFLMKVESAIIATFISSAALYGQGTLLIENVNGAKIIPIFFADGTSQVHGPNFHAVLMFGGAQVGGEYPFTLNGRFTSGSGIVVPGTTQGGTASGLTVRVWDTTTGSTFDAATVKGVSPAFDNPLGGGTTPPPKLVNLPSFSLNSGPVSVMPGPTIMVPEPSAVALGVMSAAALLFRIRR